MLVASSLFNINKSPINQSIDQPISYPRVLRERTLLSVARYTINWIIWGFALKIYLKIQWSISTFHLTIVSILFPTFILRGTTHLRKPLSHLQGKRGVNIFRYLGVHKSAIKRIRYNFLQDMNASLISTALSR